MFPLRFRLCQKGKEYKINTWIFYSKLWNFYSKFPLSPPKSCWLTLVVTGFASEPSESWAVEKNVGSGVGVGERPQHTGLQESQITSPLATDIFSLVHTVPREVSKAIPLCTHQPWLVSLGEGHFIHKNASLSFFKKKKKVVAPWWSIFKEKRKNLVCTAQSQKKLEALMHTHLHQTQFFSVFKLALC